MTYDEKIQRLLAYRMEMERLQRKCQELGKWKELAGYAKPSLPETGAKGGQGSGSGSVISTYIQIQEEMEAQAGRVNQLRGRLTAALRQMESERHRELLDRRFLSGEQPRQIAKAMGYCDRHLSRMLREAVEALDAQTDFFAP